MKTSLSRLTFRLWPKPFVSTARLDKIQWSNLWPDFLVACQPSFSEPSKRAWQDPSLA